MSWHDDRQITFSIQNATRFIFCSLQMKEREVKGKWHNRNILGILSLKNYHTVHTFISKVFAVHFVIKSEKKNLIIQIESTNKWTHTAQMFAAYLQDIFFFLSLSRHKWSAHSKLTEVTAIAQARMAIFRAFVTEQTIKWTRIVRRKTRKKTAQHTIENWSPKVFIVWCCFVLRHKAFRIHNTIIISSSESN